MPDGRGKKQHGVSRKLCVAQGCEQIQGEALQVDKGLECQVSSLVLPLPIIPWEFFHTCWAPTLFHHLPGSVQHELARVS